MIVTDLDGCLLDARSYAVDPALPMLARLRRRGVPLALCTSKTRTEVAALFEVLGGRYPSIVEDGGGILLPPGVLPRVRVDGARRTAHGRLLALGTPYAQIRRAFRQLRVGTRGAAIGFGDLKPQAIANLTGLDPAAARRAARREFDEPFLLRGNAARFAPLLRRAARRRGLVVTQGGRLYHLHGPADKGMAVHHLRRMLETVLGPVTIVALGDSPLDAPLLAAAERPVIIPRPDGNPDARLRDRVPRARVAPGPGPQGWSRAVARELRSAS